MRLFGSDRIARWMDRTGAEEGEVITHPWVTGAIGQAQKRVELQNFQARKKLLEYDDVMNQQREVIYSLRLFALEGGEELKAEAVRMIEQAVAQLADELIGATADPYQWDRAQLETEFLLKFLLSVPGLSDPARVRSRDDLVRAAQQAGREAFQAKLDYFKEIETKIGAANLGAQLLSQLTLRVIDDKWKDHLYDLDQLRVGIQFRQWGQKDPGPEGPAHRVQARGLRDVRRPDARPARHLRRAVAEAAARSGAAARPAGPGPGAHRHGPGGRAAPAAPHADGRHQGGR